MPSAEQHRLEAVRDLGVMDDRGSQEAYDRIARLAQEVFGTPVVLITFMDGQRQWFKSHLGTDQQENTPDQSFCRVPIATRRTTVVENAEDDSRFCGLPLVTSAPFLRFYAGAPLLTHDGHAIGTLCLLDVKPRTFTPSQIKMLEDLASLVITQVKMDREIGLLDPMTRLPNRLQFLLDLQAVARTNPAAERLVVLIDLIDTRDGDDAIGALGIDFYNEQIRHGAAILKRRLPSNTVYHVGGSYLTLVLEGANDGSEVLIAQLDEDLREPLLSSRGIPTTLRPCFGVRHIGLLEMASTDVLRTVLSAAREARLSEQVFAVYDTDKDAAQKRTYSLLTDLPEALRSDKQLYLVYQPRIDIASGRCISGEALLRWNHPRWGPVSPAEFFPIVEKTGLIREVTDWVMQALVSQMTQWRSRDLHIKCSFNLSSKNLFEDDIVARLGAMLENSGLAPDALEVEIVEDMNVDASQIALERLKQIRALGMGVAIDDFGSGYSNLSYLLSLPASVLKIDRSLTAKALNDRNAALTIPMIIKLGHDLGYQVVAEGIETIEIFDRLRSWGCDEAQGYLFSRPLEAAAFETWYSSAERAH